jgi:hypothetical protein
MTRYLNPFSIASEEIDTEDAGLGCRGAKMVTTEQKSPPSIPAGVPQYVLDYGEYHAIKYHGNLGDFAYNTL